jgi:hypothetical protein
VETTRSTRDAYLPWANFVYADMSNGTGTAGNRDHSVKMINQQFSFFFYRQNIDFDNSDFYTNRIPSHITPDECDYC